MLLKGVEEGGFVFYTNYVSRKGRELEAKAAACLVFLWSELERQVRIEGRVEKVAAAESDAYFASRPLGARLSAWASAQSASCSRQALEPRWPRRAPATATARRARRTGAATASCPRRSSSGRAATTGCTTGCSTAAPSGQAKRLED